MTYSEETDEYTITKEDLKYTFFLEFMKRCEEKLKDNLKWINTK